MGTEKGQRERDVCSSLLSVGEAKWPCEPCEFQTEEGGKQMRTHELKLLPLVMAMTFSFGCTQVVTIYWSKPGAGDAELQKDKEECQSLQRAVGLDEERIEKCLEVQGWSRVRQETETTTPGEGKTDLESPEK